MNVSWGSSRIDTDQDIHKEARRSFVKQPKSVIKESLQNSQDAVFNISPDDLKSKTLLEYTEEESVEIIYQIIKLTGQAKQDWLEAFDYKSYKIYLGHLIDWLRENDKNDRNKNEIIKLTEAIEVAENENQPLYLLNVVDMNTTGLIGPQKPTGDDPTNWNNFFKTLYNSSKQGGGGSWAVGKTAFATSSKIYSLIATTNTKNTGELLTRTFGMSLQKPTNLTKFIDKEADRFIADDQKNYLSTNWYFGSTDKLVVEGEVPPDVIPTSIENSDAKEINKKLFLDLLSDGVTGTAIQVPFYTMKYSYSNNQDSGDEEVKIAESLKEIAEVFTREVLEIAIESIIAKKINVKIQYADISDSDKVKINEIDLFDSINSYAITKYFKELSDDLKKKSQSSTIENDSSNLDFGNYFFNDIELQIPNKTGGPSSKFPHKSHLALKFLTDDEKNDIDEFFHNRIAIVRSAGLIIEYRKLENPESEDMPFVGIYYLGTSISNSNEDVLAEEFTRFCEDKAHNTIITGGEANLLNEEYFQKEGKTNNRLEWLRHMFIDPLQSKITEMLEKPSDDDSSKNYDLEDLLNWGSDPDSEGYISSIDVVGSSKNKARVTCKIPSNKAIDFKNYSATTADGLNNLLYGKVTVTSISLQNAQDCTHEIDGNVIKFTNPTAKEQKPTYVITYSKKTDEGQKYVGIRPDIKH
tara:strand:+ start:9110 stop:11191 length:2082 start_codon:yes stop_codon:yes gene_type:complete